MWLQLILGLLLLLAGGGAARAQAPDVGDAQVTSRVLVYSDDDATTVTTSVVDGQGVLPGSVTMGAHALVDVVSSASIDVVSAATGRWEETRLEVGGRAGWQANDCGLSLGVVRSQENDWRSNTVSGGGSCELFQKNSVLSAFYSLTQNQVGRASDPIFQESLQAHSGELGASQLLDAKTRVSASYSLQVLRGFQSSPYRYVSASSGYRGPERHPELRVRQALSAAVLRSLHPRVSLRGQYRFYTDDWGIRSSTVSLRVATELSGALVLGLEARGYWQGAARFYRDTYATRLRFMSFDRELSRFWDAGGVADLRAALGTWILDAKVGVLHYRFANFSELPKRTAVIAGCGAKMEW